MSMKLTCLCFVFILLATLPVVLSVKKGYYTIIVPQIVRYDSIFHVSITLNDFHKSCWFNVTFSKEENSQDGINQIGGIEVKPGTTRLIELHAPSANDLQFGYLNFFSYRGIIHHETARIFLEYNQYWGFLQTNKYKYKPGELVKFRLICIDQIKRPAKITDNNETIVLEIFDHQDNFIRSFNGVKLVKGVFRSEFQLSDYPVLGIWLIKARIGHRILAERKFEVDRYELSEFYVNIVSKSVVAYEEERIALEINASYFYGKPVLGNLSISIQSITPFKFTKETQINGTTTIFIDFKNDLQLENKNPNEKIYFPYNYFVEVTVTDVLSEEKFYTLTQFEVRSQPYRLELETPVYISADPILNIKVKALLKDLMDNSISDTKSPIKIIAECGEENTKNDDLDKYRFEYKNEIGKDFAIIKITNKNYKSCYLHAEYPKSVWFRHWMSVQKFGLKLEILTESPEEGKELEIKITSPEPIEEFSYEIKSRGDIIQCDHVNVLGNQTTYILRLDVTFAMVPKITIYVHHILNMEFSGAFEDVIVKRAFSNSIEIETENETKPGALVNINVTTDEASYVGLMGVDRSTLQNIEKDKILDGNFVNMKLQFTNGLKYHYLHPLHGGAVGGILVLSNIFPNIYAPVPKGEFPTLKIRTRRLFPESWLYIDFERTPAGGLQLLETVPDSITTWAITGFSINPDTGLTFTKNTTNLKVFQEFFVSFDFPNSVREGEIVEVPIYISNYMSDDASTNVAIECNSEDLEILEHPEAVPKSNFSISKLILAKEREKLHVFLKPLKHGHYNVTVTAVSSSASDAVEKTLNVQSQGIPYAMSKTYLIHLPEENTHEDEITIDIPENAVPGSQRVEVSVVGDVFRPLMEKLQKLARVPYGNGEDNMRLIVSNSIALKYLKTLKYSSPNLENKIKFNLELGYQNQLSFKYLDGSFGLVERTIARTGDIWQTVLALWGLNLAKDFVDIDHNVIKRGLKYLESKQQRNGCYKSEGGLEEDAKFTAFGLIVFLMDENSRTTYRDVIVKGLEFLFNITDDLEYSPISVMSAYVLNLGQHEKSGHFLAQLTTQSRLRSNQKQWTKSDTLQSYLETTTESLINLFESQEITEQSLLHIVRGLILPKQDETFVTHMIALQAMIGFVEKLMLNNRNHLSITLQDDHKKSGTFQLNPENSQVLQTFEVDENTRSLNLQSKGHGYAVVDVKYKYNLIPESQSSEIYTTAISTKKTSNNLGFLKICLSLNKPKTAEKADNTERELTKMDVNLQSGYLFDEKDFPIYSKLNEQIKSVQISNDRDKATIYFDSSFSKNACIELDVRKTYKVFNSKPGWIFVYGTSAKGGKSTMEFVMNDF